MFISFFDIAKSHSNDQSIFFINCFIFSFVVKHELFPLKEDHPVLKIPKHSAPAAHTAPETNMPLRLLSLLPLSYTRGLWETLTILELLKTVEEFSKHFYVSYVLDGLYSNASSLYELDIF